ncbi:MAG: gamma carbonic anhydrase family protein [Alphaproteobacteria bacterium]
MDLSNIKYKNKSPQIAENVFIAPNAVVAGDVTINDNANIWFNVVLRGDVNKITVGKNTNIQDGTVVHVGRNEGGETVIGDNITIGHSAVIHACKLEDGCFVGMQALVLDRAVVRKNAFVAAGSLVVGGTIIPEGELWAGRPAKFLRKVRPEEFDFMKDNIEVYLNLAKEYQGI